MGLKIKTFQEVLISMVDWIAKGSRRLVDFTEGSVIRTLLEAVATELEEYYFKSYNNMLYAMENAVYDAFGFERRPATSALGNIVVVFSNPIPSDLVIPKGTRVATSDADPVYYQTRTDFSVKEGASEAVIEVYCVTPGKVGNVPENSITVMVNPLSLVSRVYNPDRFITGRDEETLVERKQRFNKFVETRAKGTISAIEYGALEVEEVTGVWVDDSQIGIIKVYAHDAAGNLSDSLRKAVQDNLENYRAAGIPLFVYPIVKLPLDVEVEITVDFRYNNDDYKNEIAANIRDYLDSYVVSQEYIESDLNAYIRSLDRVIIKNCRILKPSDDTVIEPRQLIRSGNITVKLVSK
ncbi:baseplate J family protein [Bacillus phage SP-10]|uniref:baseplate J family protein n=1 Tax=Bacillus phage SP10 TaxID=941058 RepID=UPI0002198B71|nr:baseplate J family protein [Bacillus phage SP-10]BAK52969.1 baseplate J family protein [Bacillus phage SP-10]